MNDHRSTSRLLSSIFNATAVLVLLMAWSSAALAAGTDPLGTTQSSASGAIDTLVTYGPTLGGAYLLYSVASTLLARYRSASWLAQGKRLAFATGTLGVVGAALQAQIAGSPWTVIAAAAVAMAFKLLTPTVNQATNPAVTVDPPVITVVAAPAK